MRINESGAAAGSLRFGTQIDGRCATCGQPTSEIDALRGGLRKEYRAAGVAVPQTFIELVYESKGLDFTCAGELVSAR